MKRLLKEFDATNEDELLDKVMLWPDVDKEWYKGGEWVCPKDRKKIKEE